MRHEAVCYYGADLQASMNVDPSIIVRSLVPEFQCKSLPMDCSDEPIREEGTTEKAEPTPPRKPREPSPR